MSGALKRSWDKGVSWFNERPIRERVLITVTALILLLVVVWELAVTPVLSSNSALESRIGSLKQQQESVLVEQQALNKRLSSDPSQELRERLATRRARLDRLDAQLSDTTGKLIAPRAMVALLQEMLVAQKELKLVSVELLEPTPIFDQQAGADNTTVSAADAKAGPLLYAHEVELVIRGSYMNVLGYIRALEAMDDRLGWVSLDYRMMDYPDNEIRIRVRTLSLDRAWLGV